MSEIAPFCGHCAVWLTVAATLVLGSGCGADPVRSDARRFLALHAAIAYDAPAAARLESVDALEKAPFATEEVRGAQEECVLGHRALLREEERQEQNSEAIEQALANNDEGAPLPAQTLETLKVKLSASERGLSDAREQLKRCEARARSLELRFGRR